MAAWGLPTPAGRGHGHLSPAGATPGQEKSPLADVPCGPRCVVHRQLTASRPGLSADRGPGSSTDG